MIRKIRKEDAPAIQKMYECELGYKADEKIIEKMIEQLADDENYYIVVYIDDTDLEIKGFLQAQRTADLDSGNSWTLCTMAVRTQDQHHGIGSELVNSLEEYAAGEDCRSIKVCSKIERTEAHRFYEHLGFKYTKTQKCFTKEV